MAVIEIANILKDMVYVTYFPHATDFIVYILWGSIFFPFGIFAGWMLGIKA